MPELRAKAAAEEKAKLEALERTLGITSDTGNAEAGPGPSSAKRMAADVDVEEIARKRHKFDDSKFLEESREINEGVRSAVLAGECPRAMSDHSRHLAMDARLTCPGLLKKKKKPKTDGAEAAGKDQSGTVQKVKQAEKDKRAMPPPPVAKTATVA